jgi:hypothetical protein
MYFGNNPSLPNNARMPNMPQSSNQTGWGNAETNPLWLYAKMQQNGMSAVQRPGNAPIPNEIPSGTHENPPENAIAPKTNDKSTDGPVEEEVQIIEAKEKCFNKWCPLKSKAGSVRDLKRVSINGMVRTLCKKCVQAFENRQFCPFCYEIYLDGSTQNDGRDWVLCERNGCSKWVHIDCEEESIKRGLKDNLAATQYFCPDCRATHHLTVMTPASTNNPSSFRVNSSKTQHARSLLTA